MEREKPSLGLILETTPKVISVPRLNKRVESKMGNVKWHADHEFRSGLENAEALLVSTSPRKSD